jgi:AmmeMemoRadiSam system protein B
MVANFFQSSGSMVSHIFNMHTSLAVQDLLNPVWIIVTAACFLFLPGSASFSASYREALYSGSFYTSNSVKLSKEILTMLDANKKEAPKDASGSSGSYTPNALVVPHAGYVYSGDAAAAAYSRLLPEGRKKIKKVILIGPHHRVSAAGFTIMKTSAYSTPLGKIEMHEDAFDLIEKGICSACVDQDHCLEVQLPFLQTCLDSGFKIIPILAGYCSLDDITEFADSLIPYLSDDTLIVISTDFIHYGPRFMYIPFGTDPDKSAESVRENDIDVVNAFKKGDYMAIESKCRKKGLTICGRTPLTVLARIVSLSGAKPELHKYYTSGDVTGDHTNTVSYAAMSAFIPFDKLAASSETKNSSQAK